MGTLSLEFNDPVREIIHPNPEQDIILVPGGCVMTFVWCPAGAFMMDSPETELGHYLNETLHEEVIEEGFWIGKYPVTQEQYNSLTGTNPSYHQEKIMLVGNNTPVHSITHTKAMDFCDLMNKTLDLNGFEASLPGSVQWEYACRAGCSSALNNGAEISSKYGRCLNLCEVAWNPLDKVDHPQPVGKKAPNNWGIYDMHGNVWEWCLDQYIHITKKGIIEQPDPDEFVVRGGAYNTYPKFCRSACVQGKHEFREMSDDLCKSMYKDYGFRIVLNKMDKYPQKEIIL